MSIFRQICSLYSERLKYSVEKFFSYYNELQYGTKSLFLRQTIISPNTSIQRGKVLIQAFLILPHRISGLLGREDSSRPSLHFWVVIFGQFLTGSCGTQKHWSIFNASKFWSDKTDRCGLEPTPTLTESFMELNKTHNPLGVRKTFPQDMREHFSHAGIRTQD